MRKIISILLALGLVLGLSVMATPVAAVTAATVSLSTYCAGYNATYNITFTTTASLTEGVHSICINFPAGTTVPATGSAWANTDISVNMKDVFGAEVTVTGTKVCFLVPEDIGAGSVSVFFTTGAGIKNPATPGTYNVYVNTDRAPDATPVKSAGYPISPTESAYKFVVDFSPTYPGLAEDFVPPFKMCGQNDTGQELLEHGFNTTYNDTLEVWLDQFDLILTNDGLPGCATPCINATMSVTLKTAPVGATLTLSLNGAWFSMISGNSSTVVVIPLETVMNLAWDGLLHVDMAGDYQLCFKLICPAEQVPCNPPEAEVPLTEKCLNIKAYQWKDAYNVPLYHKWNLASLPLVPFDTNINNILAALPAAIKAQIMGIWNYSGGAWSNWPSPGTLTTMVDGKAYWVRVAYNSTPGYQMGDYLACLWVWGTVKPVPPASPSAYAVSTGWNMVGYTELGTMMDDDYLWNFVPGTGYGVVYGWDAVNQKWDVTVAPTFVSMTPGKGYWVPFSAAGSIYPK